jgi:ornithine--oxo-acid transaminase
MIAGIGGCNQGHVHPKILKTFIEQAQQLTLISRAIHNNNLGFA